MSKILIMGLPGSGKTTLAIALKNYLESHSKTVLRLNADEIRKEYDDWDFSYEGRIRQSIRMNDVANRISHGCDYVIADFIAPLPEMRDAFNANHTVWVNTIEAGRYEDTNKAFVAPIKYDFMVVEQDAEYWAELIGKEILK